AAVVIGDPLSVAGQQAHVDHRRFTDEATILAPAGSIGGNPPRKITGGRAEADDLAFDTLDQLGAFDAEPASDEDLVGSGPHPVSVVPPQPPLHVEPVVAVVDDDPFLGRRGIAHRRLLVLAVLTVL